MKATVFRRFGIAKQVEQKAPFLAVPVVVLRGLDSVDGI